MGHTRVGRLPRLGAWIEVIGSIADPDASAEDVGAAVMTAARNVLARNQFDKSVEVSLALLVRLVQAASSPAWREELAPLGIDVHETASARQLIAKCVAQLRRELAHERCPVLSATLATRAFAESLTNHLSSETGGLFGFGPEDARASLARLHRGEAFGRFAHAYFSTLLRRTITYFVSKELPHQIGREGRFGSIGEAIAFETVELAEVSFDATLVVREYAADWYGSRLPEGGPSPEDVPGFAAYATDKVVGALPGEDDAS